MGEATTQAMMTNFTKSCDSKPQMLPIEAPNTLRIPISCLGLFGLASFMAEQRTKEIGIRKVLGASIGNIWGLLSQDFVKLVIIACVVASPIAYYGMSKWLEDYKEYKINIGAGVFVAVLILALVITLLTVSYQAIKAALMNPVKSLKSE